MLLMRISVTFLLFVFILFVEDSEEGDDGQDDNKSNGSSQRLPGTQDGSFANKSSGDNCSEYQNAFHHELINLTSNSQINITTDVILLSFVSLVGLESIAIIGHDNPTINCNSAGGIYFENCNNCTIVGVTWENCGIKNDGKPVIELHNSSDITIQNSTFQHSVTQVLVFSKVSGNVTIIDCKFAFNKKSVGHGTVLYYESKIENNSKFQFTISDCNFIENGIHSESIVYISSSNNKSIEQMVFINISFLNNQAVPIYISHQNVHATGSILFKGNLADKSGGIFITNNSNAQFYNSYMKFSNNKALNNGGAFHIQNNSDVTFKGNCTVTMEGNQATSGGGLYVSNNSDVTFEGNSLITINSSIATKYGGGLSVMHNSKVNFTGKCKMIIKNSEALHGGAVYIEDNSDVMFEGNPEAVVNSNLAKRGGAIFLRITLMLYSKETLQQQLLTIE